MITKAYIRDLIPRIITLLENNKIQSAVLLGNMGDYIKEIITLRKKFDDIETLKEENKELREQLTKQGNAFNMQMNQLKYFLGVDEDKFKDSIKKRHQELKKEKGK